MTSKGQTIKRSLLMELFGDCTICKSKHIPVFKALCHLLQSSAANTHGLSSLNVHFGKDLRKVMFIWLGFGEMVMCLVTLHYIVVC